MSTYFEGLNYGLANEDTWIEHRLAPENARSFFSVCGSGSRVIPLLAKNPEHLHIVDLSETQLALFRLRYAAIKALDYQDYLFFLGYHKRASHGTKRSELMKRLDLEEGDLRLWKSQEFLWEDKGFIYLGKWESHFMKVGKLFQALTFTNLRPLFETKDFQEQKSILDAYWHPKLFKLYTGIIMNEWVANRFLYKGSYAGAKDKRTMDVSAARFVFNEFNDLFNNTWVKGNYFLNMIFLNEVAMPESFPAECDEGIFQAVKKGKTKIFFHKQNLLGLLLEEAHDFYSLSDTFSYMRDEEVRDFLQQLPKEIKPKSQIVIRTFMSKPSFSISPPWTTNPSLNRSLAKEDCTRMYEFSVLEKA